MLDQNTDRMWYVIGAVLIGAAIIFGMNTLMPNTFASISDNFETLLDTTTAKMEPSEEQMTVEDWFAGATMLMETNDFSFLNEWRGSTVTLTPNTTVSEWNTSQATHIHTTGGDDNVKFVRSVIDNQRQSKDMEYLAYIQIKNIGDIPLFYYTNTSPYKTSAMVTIQPGESKDVFSSVQKGGTSNMQIQFRTRSEDRDKDLEFIIHDYRLGYRPKEQ